MRLKTANKIITWALDFSGVIYSDRDVSWVLEDSKRSPLPFIGAPNEASLKKSLKTKLCDLGYKGFA